MSNNRCRSVFILGWVSEGFCYYVSFHHVLPKICRLASSFAVAQCLRQLTRICAIKDAIFCHNFSTMCHGPAPRYWKNSKSMILLTSWENTSTSLTSWLTPVMKRDLCIVACKTSRNLPSTCDRCLYNEVVIIRENCRGPDTPNMYEIRFESELSNTCERCHGPEHPGVFIGRCPDVQSVCKQ